MDIYSSASLVAMIEERATEGPKAYFKERYFTRTPLFSTDEKIYFDVIDKARRLAPYVSPLVEGKVMEHRGYRTRVFEPPYLKPKSVINPSTHMFQRRPGEPIGGGRTPADRWAESVVEILDDHNEAIVTREEVQAVEGLFRGRVTVTGEGYGTVVLNFGRHADLTVTLAGAATWDNDGVDVIKDIEDWAQRVFDHGGGKASDVFFGLDAWSAFRDRLTEEQKKLLFDSLRGSQSRAELGPQLPDYVKYVGSIGEFDFYTVNQKYQDENGNEVDLLPRNGVVMVSPAVEGTPTYAAIRDKKANFASVRAFSKMWANEDPAVDYLMTQSAPLMVPLRPNASLGATVLP